MNKEILLYEEDIILNLQESTDVGDIAKTDPKSGFSKPTVPSTLPALLGYVQKINAPTGFVFGLTRRDKTAIPGINYPEDPENPASPADPADLVITRKMVETEVREVAVSTTNEVEQDIIALFGGEFSDDISLRGHRTSDKETPEIAKFFMEYGEWNLNSKINSDFTTWLDTVASLKGTAIIDTYNDMHKILGVIGELREALSKQTGKNGKPWILVTPRIAAFLASTVGFISHNKAEWYNDGRIDPNTEINPYIGSYGDIDVYTSLPLGGNPGSGSPTTETAGSIYMGYKGGPGISSIYYMPYKKYIVRGGSSAYTGQSTIFYRIRDAWTANPADTADHANTDTTISDPVGNSKYIVKADITFNEQLLN